MHSLAKEIKEGNRVSFSVLYKAEFDNLHFFIKHYVHDSSLSKDIVQEAFIALWNNKGTIDENRNIRTFLYSIARNKAINVLKSKYHTVNRLKAIELKADINALSSEYVTEKIDALTLEDLIEKVYSNLPKTVKKSFELSRKESMTNEEIADLLGISVRSVEYHIHTSLAIFREKLKDYLTFFFAFLLLFLYN
jgi:RNA polymerase sigma-70 factor, ECF subfamily